MSAPKGAQRFTLRKEEFNAKWQRISLRTASNCKCGLLADQLAVPLEFLQQVAFVATLLRQLLKHFPAHNAEVMDAIDSDAKLNGLAVICDTNPFNVVSHHRLRWQLAVQEA
ncbi:hypothetical protein PQR36_04220 [Paraburkholderia nemoris]